MISLGDSGAELLQSSLQWCGINKDQVGKGIKGGDLHEDQEDYTGRCNSLTCISKIKHTHNAPTLGLQDFTWKITCAVKKATVGLWPGGSRGANTLVLSCFSGTIIAFKCFEVKYTLSFFENKNKMNKLLVSASSLESVPLIKYPIVLLYLCRLFKTYWMSYFHLFLHLFFIFLDYSLD